MRILLAAVFFIPIHTTHNLTALRIYPRQVQELNPLLHMTRIAGQPLSHALYVTPKGPRFLGACIYTVASTSFIGHKQAKAFCAASGQMMRPARHSQTFIFGKGSTASSALALTRIPTPIGSFLQVEVDVMRADVPFLLVLDVLTAYGFTLDFCQDRVISTAGGCHVPLVRDGGHVFWRWSVADILLTIMELHKLHLNLLHSSSSNLYILVRLARPKDVTPETRKILEDISRSCTTCGTHQLKRLRFRVTMPDEDLLFNRDLSMDIMYIYGVTVLHVVDVATGFGNAAALPGASVDDVWTTFISIWATVYPDYPNKLHVDSGSVFTSPRRTRSTD